MTPDTILILIIASMIITSICNFLKRSIDGLLKKKQITLIAMGFSFVLGLIASFSIDLGIELEVGTKIILGLALGTGSGIWYDVWKIVQEFNKKDNEIIE